MLSINNKLVEQYIEEIRNLEQKIRNLKITKTQTILFGLETYFVNLLEEILVATNKEKAGIEEKKEELKKWVENKKLLNKHLI